ncbi:MAG TPA: hypothetical protein VGQ05_21105 [Streptosporangiaceae bacterium]|nr:hypothetical protein [Streptosporangiaceae bacterium]
MPSHLYSLSFAPTPDWTHTYSAQPEILAYLWQTADRLGVRGHIRPHGRNSVLWPDYTWRFRRLLGRFDLRPYRQLGRTP